MYVMQRYGDILPHLNPRQPQVIMKKIIRNLLTYIDEKFVI